MLNGDTMITIEQRHIDYYCGQHNMALIATRDGIYAGTLSYALYEEKPSVTMIEVVEVMRGTGVGTALIIALQEEYPDTVLNFGTLTSEGVALLSSINWDVRPNAIHSEAVLRLSIVEDRLASYSRRAEVSSGATQAEKDAFVSEVADWNDLHNEADELRDIINHTDESFRFVSIDRPVRMETSSALSP
jgi:hypothetical protein